MESNEKNLFPSEDIKQKPNKKKASPKSTSKKSTSKKITIQGLIDLLNKENVDEPGFTKLTLSLLGNKYENLIDAIIWSYKAKKYIGVGVGCILLNEEKDKVLLYKRYKNPEKDKWSMPGGGVKLKKLVEDVALEELSFITGIKFFTNEKNKNFKLKLLKVTNHYPNSDESPYYHYVSPAFYIDINKDSDLRRKIKKSFPENNMSAFVPYEEQKQKKGLKDKYELKWFPIDISEALDSFTQTTVYALQALQKHLEYSATVNELNGKVDKLPALFDTIFEDVMNI